MLNHYIYLLPFTPLQISVGLKVTLISFTFHAFEVFTIPITILVETYVQSKPTKKNGIQVITIVEPIAPTTWNLTFSILRTKSNFEAGENVILFFYELVKLLNK
jgi:hypothetical protein